MCPDQTRRKPQISLCKVIGCQKTVSKYLQRDTIIGSISYAASLNPSEFGSGADEKSVRSQIDNSSWKDV
jgi:hypothetical protein